MVSTPMRILVRAMGTSWNGDVWRVLPVRQCLRPRLVLGFPCAGCVASWQSSAPSVKKKLTAHGNTEHRTPVVLHCHNPYKQPTTTCTTNLSLATSAGASSVGQHIST